MDQQLQESYLNTMGVTLWYPRFVLPNAPELDWPVSADSAAISDQQIPEAQLQQAQDNPKSDVSLSKLRSLMSEDEPSPSKHNQKKEERVSVVSTEAVSSLDDQQDVEVVKPFGFLFFRYPLGVSTLVSVPGGEPLSSMELRFIHAVLSFMGVEEEAEFTHRVSWPLVQHSPQFSTRSFFNESMKALFTKQAVACGVDTFLLFGQRVSDELTALLTSLESSDKKVHVITAPELPELLTSAQAKRDLWKSLVSFKQSVQAS